MAVSWSPIPDGYKGRLRWNAMRGGWDWVEAGPYFRVFPMRNGKWRVSRVYL